MVVRLHDVKKRSSQDYRLRPEVIDPERSGWEARDCRVQIDVRDGVNGKQHAFPRGLLKVACAAYAVSPSEAPSAVDGPPPGRWAARSTTTAIACLQRALFCAFPVGPDDSVGTPQVLR